MELDGTIFGDNGRIDELNKDINNLVDTLMLNKDKFEASSYIMDFEEYEIELMFSNGENRMLLTVSDDILNVAVGDKNIKISPDGTIVEQ